MDVLLLDPGAANAATWTIGLLRQPIKMALVQLYSFLKAHQAELPGVNVSICDLEWELEQPNDPASFAAYAGHARERLRGQPFDVVAISCWTSLKYRLSVQVAAVCRQLNPACVVVVGGWHAAAQPEDFLYEGSPFDHVITGEGEFALLELLRALPRQGLPRLLAGRPVLPEEEVTLLWEDYPIPQGVPVAPMFFSRGCPFMCNYCMEPFVKGRSWRALPPEQAIARLERLVATRGTRYIDLHDPIFAPQKAWRRAFLQGLIDRGWDRFIWCEGRSDLMEDTDLELLSRAPIQIDFGTESASAEMLALMEKTRNPGLYLERSRQTLLSASRHGVACQVYLITHHPGERLLHVEQTLEFFRALLREMPSTSILSISAQPYRYYPGTAVSRRREEFYQRFGTVVSREAWWREDLDMRDASVCTRDTHLSDTEQEQIDTTWRLGLEELAAVLQARRDDRAARTLARRSASFLDLALWMMRVQAPNAGQTLLGAPPNT